jgi:hypothetical protein
MSVTLLQHLISQGQNLAARALTRDAKGASSLHPGRIGSDAVMATISSAITALRSTPASMPIQGAFSGATLIIAIAELSVCSDRLLRQSKHTGDVLLSSDPIEARRFYFSPMLNSVCIFYTNKQLEWLMLQKIRCGSAIATCLVH